MLDLSWRHPLSEALGTEFLDFCRLHLEFIDSSLKLLTPLELVLFLSQVILVHAFGFLLSLLQILAQFIVHMCIFFLVIFSNIVNAQVLESRVNVWAVQRLGSLHTVSEFHMQKPGFNFWLYFIVPSIRLHVHRRVYLPWFSRRFLLFLVPCKVEDLWAHGSLSSLYCICVYFNCCFIFNAVCRIKHYPDYFVAFQLCLLGIRLVQIALFLNFVLVFET